MSTVIRPEVSRKNRYWVSRDRYYELKHFCLQYPEWKKNYISLDGLPTRASGTGEHLDGGKTPDPTAIFAEARLYYRDRMDMVERSCEKAAGDMGKLMLKAVTEGISYEHMMPPCCRDVWYEAYRKFFWTLDKERG